jgi:hypothetical protein
MVAIAKGVLMPRKETPTLNIINLIVNQFPWIMTFSVIMNEFKLNYRCNFSNNASSMKQFATSQTLNMRENIVSQFASVVYGSVTKRNLIV